MRATLSVLLNALTLMSLIALNSKRLVTWIKVKWILHQQLNIPSSTSLSRLPPLKCSKILAIITRCRSAPTTLTSLVEVAYKMGILLLNPHKVTLIWITVQTIYVSRKRTSMENTTFLWPKLRVLLPMILNFSQNLMLMKTISKPFLKRANLVMNLIGRVQR